MGSLKTLLLALFLAHPVMAGDVTRATVTPDSATHLFAICAGRLSALREHQWAFDGPASEQTGKDLAAMTDLLAAVSLPEQAVATMALRIEAKLAQRALLTRATLAPDPIIARHVANRAAQLMSGCTGLLLG